MKTYKNAMVKRIRPGQIRMIVNGRCVYRPTSEVSHIRSVNNYVEYVFRDGSTYLSAYPMAVVEGLIGKDFIRTHKASMVHVDCVASVNSRASTVTTVSGAVLPIARRRMGALQACREAIKSRTVLV